MVNSETNLSCVGRQQEKEQVLIALFIPEKVTDKTAAERKIAEKVTVEKVAEETSAKNVTAKKASA